MDYQCKEKLLNSGKLTECYALLKENFLKCNCARVAIAVFYLYMVVPFKVGRVTENFFWGGQPAHKCSKTTWIYMKNTLFL